MCYIVEKKINGKWVTINTPQGVSENHATTLANELTIAEKIPTRVVFIKTREIIWESLLK